MASTIKQSEKSYRTSQKELDMFSFFLNNVDSKNSSSLETSEAFVLMVTLYEVTDNMTPIRTSRSSSFGSVEPINKAVREHLKALNEYLYDIQSDPSREEEKRQLWDRVGWNPPSI